MKSDEVPVLALDGPSGSGKGTVGQICAQRLGWRYLDSGAIYRALAYALRRQGGDPDDLEQQRDSARTLQFACRPAPPDAAEIFVNGERAADEIRSEAVGELASKLAGRAEIRATLLQLQREARRFPGLVADGRDMGTAVFPTATLKIFLTANAEERAKRRYNQLKLKGFDVSLAALFLAIQERDTRDSERTESPLVAAPDAVMIDSSDLAIDEVVTRILDLLKRRLEIAGIDIVSTDPA